MRNHYRPTDTIPIRDQDHMICSEEKRIKQILINLQSNAIKFTKEGGSIQIIVEFIKKGSKSKKKKETKQHKRLYFEGFSSSDSEQSDDELD